MRYERTGFRNRVRRSVRMATEIARRGAIRYTDRAGSAHPEHPLLPAPARKESGSCRLRLARAYRYGIQVASLVGAAAYAFTPLCASAAPFSPSALTKIHEEEKAFQRSLKSLPSLALSPQEIRAYQKRRDKINQVVRSGDGHLSYSVVPVHLNPGAQAPVVALTTGTVLALTFIDSTGAPWPVTSQTVGNARWFHVTAPKGLADGNLLLVTPLVRLGTTNVIVTLKGQDSPITVVLRAQPHRSLLPSVVNILVPGIGPNGTPPTLVPAGPQTINAQQIGFLDGVPPAGALSLTVTPTTNTQAWRYHHQIYLRTRANLIFPAWTAVVRGSHHMRVYTITRTPVVLVMRHGHQQQLALHGDDHNG